MVELKKILKDRLSDNSAISFSGTALISGKNHLHAAELSKKFYRWIFLGLEIRKDKVDQRQTSKHKIVSVSD